MPPPVIIVDGLVQSSIYITMAFGMVLVFSILGILNWIHGQYYMLGAMLVYYAVCLAGIPFPFSILISGVIVALAGIIVKKYLMDPVNDMLYVGVLMMAMMFVMEGLASMLFGIQDKGMASVLPGVQDFGLFSISYQKIAVVCFTVIVLVAMYIVLNRTSMGLSIRAAAQEPVAANLYGIRVDRVSIMVMGIGCMLAGCAGAVMAPVGAINPYMGRTPMIMSLLAIVLGGIGSLTGAIVGGIILGLLNSIVTYYVSEMSEVLLFLLVIIILLVRPQGLFGVGAK